MRSSSPNPHAHFFSSIKQVEKRLKLEHNTSTPPSINPTSLTNSQSLSSPLYIHLDQPTSNTLTFQESEAPQEFLTKSLDFPETQKDPLQESIFKENPERFNLFKTGGVDDIENLMQLLGFENDDQECVGLDLNSVCDDGFYGNVVKVKGPKCKKEVERLNWDANALSMSDEFPVMQFADEKGRSLSMGGTELKEGMALHGLTLVDEEQSIYSTKFSSFHGEETIGGFAPDEEKIIFSEPIDPSEGGLESNVSQSPMNMDEVHDDEDDGSDLPSVDWWKKRAASLFAQAKEANAVWSILFAAAVLGVVMIGHKWQQSKWQCGDEKKKMLGPLSGLKSILVGSQPSGSVVRGSTTSQL